MEKEIDGNRYIFWMKVAAVAFGLWSLMIPIGITLLQKSVDKVVEANEHFLTNFNQYVLSMERRTTLLEERQIQLLKAQEESRKEIDDIRHKDLPTKNR